MKIISFVLITDQYLIILKHSLYICWGKKKQRLCFSQNILKIPFPYRAEAYFHNGFVIWSQTTLIRETNQDMREVLGDWATRLHSLQQGGVSTPLQVRSLKSKQSKHIILLISHLLLSQLIIFYTNSS